jgi:uncharacterized protein (TIGR03083 family)
MDWSAPAGALRWSCRRTLDHIVDTLVLYAAHLASRATTRLPLVRDGAPHADLDELFAALAAEAAVLAEVAAAAGPDVRAFHPAGMADASGFVAMGCDEVLVHTGDIAAGLGVDFRPPEELARRVLARLFPWAPPDVHPWDALSWANGRRRLPGHERLGPDWYWHCAPLSEWDGTRGRRLVPPAWT